MFEPSRSSFSSIITSTINVHQNVSTFNNLPYTMPPVPPEIRNIVSENHSSGHNMKTPPTPSPRWATPLFSARRGRCYYAYPVTPWVVWDSVGGTLYPRTTPPPTAPLTGTNPGNAFQHYFRVGPSVYPSFVRNLLSYFF